MTAHALKHDTMRIVFSVDLNNRHRQHKELLEVCVRDAVLAFNLRTHAEANVKNVRVFFDEAEVHLGPVTGAPPVLVTKPRKPSK